MQDRDDIPILRAFEILISLNQRIVGKPTRRVRKECLRLYFLVHCLRKGFTESQPEDERTEIVNAGYGSKVLQETPLPA